MQHTVRAHPAKEIPFLPLFFYSMAHRMLSPTPTENSTVENVANSIM